MAWIEQIEEQEAEGELERIYQDLTERRGKIANIIKVHSLNPGAMQAHVNLYMHLMFGRSGLSRAEREAIAVVVSAANNCAYCVNHHAEALARYEKDNERLRRIVSGFQFMDLEDRTAKMLSHAVRLTTSPAQVDESDLDSLREVGFSDAEILDISLVTAYFNFVNRLALGLGVEYTEDEMQGYKT